MGRPLKYDEAFKLNAVELVTKQGYSLREAAGRLGINNQTLHHWVKRYGDPDAKGKQSEADLRREILELRKENARLKMEREILKKATAFFAKEQP